MGLWVGDCPETSGDELASRGSVWTETIRIQKGPLIPATLLVLEYGQLNVIFDDCMVD